MAITFGGLAKMSTQAGMAMGQAQSSSMGLGKKSGDLLGMSNIMGGDKGKGLVNSLMGGSKKSGGLNGNMMGSKKNLSYSGIKSANESILGAAYGGSGSLFSYKA